MSDVSTRMMIFSGTAVQVDFTPGRSAEIVEFLLNRVPCSLGASAAQARLCLRENPASGVFTVSNGGQVCCIDRSAGAVASWLLHLICRELARRGRNGLLIHAAAVSWRGHGFLLPGVSGSGKSTLTAFLTQRGFGYLTDELVYVPWGSATMEGFAAPLKVKKRGLDSLEGHVLISEAASMAGPHDVLVQPSGSGGPPPAVPLSAVIFPRYQRDARLRLEPLSPAQTGLRLMAGILNGQTLPDHGFREAARLAGGAAGYELSYANLSQIEAHLDLLRSMISPADQAPR